MRDVVSDFVEAACVPLHWHAAATTDRAREILALHPEVATADIYTAAILGNADRVAAVIARDRGLATRKGGPRDWDALTYLCFSNFLKLDRSRSAGFLRAATVLLDAGADPHTGFYDTSLSPPEFESLIYGAAGFAQHPDLTRLLLERGVDPNDNETPYHAPETTDNAALKVLVESGKLTDDSLTTMLLRKADWHDYEAIAWLLDRGVNPNRTTKWRKSALQQAVLRDNALESVAVMLDHGGDPTLPAEHGSAVQLSARRGRSDLLALFAARGFSVDLAGVDALAARCALGDAPGVRAIAEREPATVKALVAGGAQMLSEFAGVGNTGGVRLLLDLGVDVAAVWTIGDGYWGVPGNSTALHVAAWRARHGTVRLLIERGAPIDALDGKGRTPLALAVRACVDSHWTEWRSPESVAALIAAGASVAGIPIPCGYADVDRLLEAARF